jgi:predicted Zn-dependent protease
MGGPCAVVSTHRLRQELYGLPADPNYFVSA